MDLTKTARNVKTAEVNVNVSCAIPLSIIINVNDRSSSSDILDGSLRPEDAGQTPGSMNDFIATIDQVIVVPVDGNRQHVQDSLSTSITEALLAVFWLCTVAAIPLSRIENLLPENSYSIAAQAGPFAVSQLFSLIPGDIGHLKTQKTGERNTIR